MISYKLVYELQTQANENTVRHYFVSQGTTDIIKVIQYNKLGEYNGRAVFNLGFGNYDLVTDTINDNDNCNNGDAYQVFNTVLSTIPLFFEKYPDAYLLAMGSDSSPDYPAGCRLQCKKNCPEGTCRNFRRRIKLYQEYVNKHWATLNEVLAFLGGTLNVEGQVETENYVRHRPYDAVLVFKRNT